MNQTPKVCKFSPLTTPLYKASKERLARLARSPSKFQNQEGVVSDVESVTSVTTRDIRALAKSVQQKMAQGSTLDSDEDLFLTQGFDKNVEVQKPKRVQHALSDSESDSDVSSVLVDFSQTGTGNGNMVTTDETDKISSSQSPKKKQSQLPDTDKTKRVTFADKNSSDSELDSSSTDLSDSSDSETETQSNIRDKQAKASTSSEDIYAVKSLSKSDKRGKLSSPKSSSSSMGSEDRQEVLPEREMRFEVPQSFEVKTADKIVPRASLEGKEIWLISIPEDFDISNMDGQTLNLNGDNIINAKDKSEKKWEVASFPNYRDQSQLTSMCTVGADSEGGESLRIGPEVSGQLVVMDWIPAMPPVQLTKQSPVKHRVPDHLKPTFTPFGANTPERITSSADSHKKAKKRQKGREEPDSTVIKKMKMVEHDINKTVDHSIVITENVKKKKKKHRKHSEMDSGGNDVDSNISAVKTEVMEMDNSVVPIQETVEYNYTQTDSQKKTKKKKKKNKIKEEGVLSVDLSSNGGLGVVNDRTDASENEIVRKRKKEKKSIDHIDSSSKEKKKKKKHKKEALD